MRTHSWRYAKEIWSITCVLWRIRWTSVCLNCLRRKHLMTLRRQWSIKMLMLQRWQRVCYYTHRPNIRMRINIIFGIFFLFLLVVYNYKIILINCNCTKHIISLLWCIGYIIFYTLYITVWKKMQASWKSIHNHSQ